MSKQSGPFLGMFDLQTGPLKQQNCASSGFIFIFGQDAEPDRR